MRNVYTLEQNYAPKIYSFAESILISTWFMLWLQRNSSYSFEIPDTVYKSLQKLFSFSNITLNKRIQKALAFWIFRILYPFDYQKGYIGTAPEILIQCLYGYTRYCWVGVKQFNIDNIANNH